MRELDSLAQKLPCLAASVVAAEQRAQIDEGACMLEPGRRVREYLDRFAQQLFPGLSTLDKAERTQRDADRARRAPAFARVSSSSRASARASSVRPS